MNKILIFITVLMLQTFANAQSEKNSEFPLDTILKNKLESIRVKDQTLRLILPEIEKKFGKDSEEKIYFWSVIHRQDSINEIEVINIIDKYGWVGANNVGVLANQALWLVIQHAPIEIQEKYLPYLKVSVEKGESEGWHLAFLEDRVLMRNGEKQIYGTQSTFNKESGEFHIYPISNVENVNERRKKIGLDPIEEYAEKNGYIFNQDNFKSYIYNDNGQLRIDTTLKITQEQFDIWDLSENYILEILSNNIEYSRMAREAGMKGIAIIAFDCDTLDLRNIRTIKKLGGGLDENIIEGIKKVSDKIIFEFRHIPGQKDGERIKYIGTYYIPFDFSLIDFKEEMKKTNAIPIIDSRIPLNGRWIE